MKKNHDLNKLLAAMESYIPDYIIERGLEYYENGLVENVNIDGQWVHATVLGNYGDYNVKVHMADFSKSRCSCPYEDYCKHMAAVVYQLTREYAGEQGYSEPAGGPGRYKPDETESVAEPSAKQPDDDLDQRLKSMGREDLLGAIKQLMETDPSSREKIRLILVEHERTADLHSDRVCRMGLYSSLKYHQQQFSAILKECESLFTEIDMNDEDSDDDWGYGNEYAEDAWNFTMGLERLHRYGRELLKLVTSEHYISGTVGLLVAVKGLEEWIDKYDDEYSGSELVDGCSEFENYLWEALAIVGQCQLHDPQAQTFLRELIDWVVHQCKQLDDLLAWTAVLTHCVPERRYLWHLKERIMQLDRDFLRSDRLQDERARRALVYWWVQLCLSLNQEEEAKQTACILGETLQADNSLAYCFVRYYERREEWQEAVRTLQNILNANSRVNPQEYQWIIHLCQQSGDKQGVKEWHEKWFLSHPDLDLFKRNAALHKDDDDKEARIQKWIDAMRRKREYALAIGMHLYLDDIDKAWAEFIRHKDRIEIDEPLLLKLFKKMKKHEPARLIPLYRDLALINISRRGRRAYAKAARWMKDLREVCSLSGKSEEWAAFHGQVMTEYRRFRSLMEEIRAAGIGQP
ncbi:SWIM zinc finger family [Desulfocucumis palustris]|uniref:SWIM zinc finger family n=1 Tax=Desulfocucumis palustris TaxID=1898651 RepID=A0A2L2XH35_9FIRM|nr:SWIM zinc finger family protein [Desulfocucumis palustris]GBF35442.1 SWIM zinc finger family [Desulfocucumis palustris]